jgi:DegV family protein with EDD domain
MVKIIADSCCDLSPELIDRYDIGIIPLNVLFDKTSYKDGITINTLQLFDLVERYGSLPKTSPPSIDAFWEVFDQPDEIIFISIGSKLSATNQIAQRARDTSSHGNIHIIDSSSVSTGIGLLVMRAAELSKEGYSASQIMENINLLIPRVHSFFLIDTLDYLHKGGRLSAIELLMGGLLKIHPVIEVRPDGSLGVRRKVNGNRKKALLSMVEDFSSDLPVLDSKRVFITHTLTDETEADAHFLKSEIEKIADIDEFLFTKAGATIASHCGPETIAISYLTK